MEKVACRIQSKRIKNSIYFQKHIIGKEMQNKTNTTGLRDNLTLSIRNF